MAETPLLADLREPPVKGRFYMVPVIDFIYFGRESAWPTLGPLHHDRGPVNFPHLHFHVDPRFLTSRQAQFVCRRGWGHSIEVTVAGTPLNYSGREIPRRPRLERRKCRVSTWRYSPPGTPRWMAEFDRIYGKVAEPIRIRDGRLLCPHRRVDLSQMSADENGVVTCPLHGLRVRCGGHQAVPV